MNKIKDSISSDKQETHTHPAPSEAQHHTHASDARAPRHNEPHSNLLSSAQQPSGAYTSNNAYTTTSATGPATTTAGPHSSNLMNKADPRVDSDMDGRNAFGAQTHGTSHVPGAHTGNTIHSTSGHHQHNTNPTTGLGSTGPASTTAGPHSSNLMNKADPRVDSDLDGSKTVGKDQTLSGNTAAYGMTNPSMDHAMPSAYSANSGTTATGPASSTAGPHSSNMMNKVDPRIDSDLDGSKTVGGQSQTFASNATTQGMTNAGFNPSNPAVHGTHTTHATNTGIGSTGPASSTAGPHSSNLMNKADPRVDSDLDGSKTVGQNQTFNTTHNTHNTTGAATTTSHAHPHQTHNTHGQHHTTAAGADVKANLQSAATGPAPNTAGPHKSDLLNKLDPRVDSNLDGSKTLGSNQTFNH